MDPRVVCLLQEIFDRVPRSIGATAIIIVMVRKWSWDLSVICRCSGWIRSVECRFIGNLSVLIGWELFLMESQ